MILDACGGRGNGEKDAGKGQKQGGGGGGVGRLGGWTGRRGWGRVDGNGRERQEVGVEGCNLRGRWGLLKFSMFSVHKNTISNIFLEFSNFKIVDLVYRLAF